MSRKYLFHDDDNDFYAVGGGGDGHVDTSYTNLFP
jgi:hypothetical protein